jgi:dihydroorotate dehydrogenase
MEAGLPLKRFLISPPFGNYISHAQCTSVKGSFTLDRRPGLIWHTLKSLRPVKGGWVNRIGLRNVGLAKVSFRDGCVYSVVGLDEDDWTDMLPRIPEDTMVEINLGCPNVHKYGIEPHVISLYHERFWTIVKVPATDLADEVVALAIDHGADYLHLANTIPTPRGGESGKRCKELNLPLVERVRKRYPDVKIIAGGGIYSHQDVLDYEAAGANHFSLSTVWFNPFRALKILKADRARESC